MKKFVIALLCISVVIGAFALTATAAGAAVITVTPSATDINPGDTVQFDVTVSSDAAVKSIGFDLKYDADVFDLVSGQWLTAAEMTMPTFDTSKGQGVAFGLYNAPAALEKTVFTFTLKAKEAATLGDTTVTVVSKMTDTSNVAVTCTDNGAALKVELVPAPPSSVDLKVEYVGVAASATVYSLDVAWENDDLTFNYFAGTQGAWNPVDHTYGETTGADWEDDDLVVTVTNHSNAEVNVSMGITDGDDTDDLTVTSDKPSETLPTAEGTAVANAPKVDFTLTIEGTPTKSTAKVATATLTFAKP